MTRGYVLASTMTNEKKSAGMVYPVYSSQTKDNGLMGYYKDYLYEDAITWTTDGANAGTVNYRTGKFYCTNVCGVLLSKKIKANPMIAEALNKIAKQYVSYVGNPKLMNNVMADIELQIPKQEEEREQLSQTFVSLDNLITLHQRKYSKKLQTWEQRKLNDFGIATGGTSIESEFSNNGKYKVISIGSYSENSNYNDQGIRAIYSDKTKLRVLNKEDLTMILNDKTASGRIIGRVLYIDKSGEYVYNQRTERIEINKELYKSRFIYHLLNAPEMRNKIIKQSQGNTQIFVNWNSIKNTEYLVPNLNEQNQLEKIFDSIDNLITLHQRKLEKLKEVKKSMLEKMFV